MFLAPSISSTSADYNLQSNRFRHRPSVCRVATSFQRSLSCRSFRAAQVPTSVVYLCSANKWTTLSGTVFHAIDSNGEQVALKVYVKNDDGTKALDKPEFNRKVEEATQREKERLLAWYPCLEEKVDVVKVFEGLHCVVMPFFTPLLKEERREALPPVTSTLYWKTFKKKGTF